MGAPPLPPISFFPPLFLFPSTPSSLLLSLPSSFPSFQGWEPRCQWSSDELHPLPLFGKTGSY